MLTGITSEQRPGVHGYLSVWGEGAVGWSLVGDEHHEPWGMLWQKVTRGLFGCSWDGPGDHCVRP